MSKYLLLVLFLVCGAFGAYFKYTESKIEGLIAEAETLKVANERNQATIDNLQLTAEQNAERNRELQASLDQAEQGLNTLRRTLQEHNLTRLAAEKPGLIEPRMQGATNELFENFFTYDEPSDP